jgi:hypothetical protein
MDWDAYFGGAPTQSVVPQTAGINWDNYFGGEAMDMATDPPERPAPRPPRAPGWSDEEWFEMTSRQPKQSGPVSLSELAAKTASDPLGTLGEYVGKVYTKYGGNPAMGERLARDIPQIPAAMGPLGMEFSPAGAMPRSAKPTVAEMPKASVRSQEELFQSGGARMNEAKASEAVIDPTDLQSATVNLHNRLREKSLAIDPKAHPNAARLMRRLQLAVGSERPPTAGMTGYEAKPRTMQELHLLRQEADDVIGKGVRPDGRLNTEGLLGKEMKSAVDEMIAKHPDGNLLKQGMSEWGKAEKSRLLSDAMYKAKQSATWRNGNEAAAIQSQIRSLLTNKQYKNTWSPEQRTALEQVGKRRIINGLATFGSTSITGVALGRVLESALGIPFGMLWGAGALARKANNANVAGRVEGVSELIRAGGPVEVARTEKLSKLFSPNVLKHITSNPRGAELVRRWTMAPDAQTARALSAYVAGEVKMPELARRIFAEIQGTDESQADQ